MSCVLCDQVFFGCLVFSVTRCSLCVWCSLCPGVLSVSGVLCDQVFFVCLVFSVTRCSLCVWCSL